MIALSIRQPWAWLIVNGHKDVENRSWPTEVRGQFLVHAGKAMTRAEYDDALDFIRRTPSLSHIAQHVPPREQLQRGGIVGEARITGCVRASASPWFVGEYGFQIERARPVPFHPVKGQLRWFAVSWNPPDDPYTCNLV